MSKFSPVIIASSALLLALQAGQALSETPKKKAASAKKAVFALQNGYTASDTSARPQLIDPSEYALIKAVGTSGGGTDGTIDPDGAQDTDTPSGGTGGLKDPDQAQDTDTPSGGTGGLKDPDQAQDTDTPNGGTGPGPGPQSAG